MTQSEVFKTVQSIVAQKLNVAPELVTGASSAHTLPSWDSLAHMEIIVEIENQLKIRFSFDDMVLMNNLDSLISVSISKLSTRN